MWLPDKVLNSWQRQYFKRKSNFQTLRKFWAWKTTQDQRESWRVECWHVTRRVLQTIGTVLAPHEGMGRTDPSCRSGDLKAEGIRALIFRSSLRSHKLHGGPIWVQRQESWNSYMLCPDGQGKAAQLGPCTPHKCFRSTRMVFVWLIMAHIYPQKTGKPKATFWLKSTRTIWTEARLETRYVSRCQCVWWWWLHETRGLVPLHRHILSQWKPSRTQVNLREVRWEGWGYLPGNDWENS